MGQAMTGTEFWSLARQTLFEPRLAAARILGMGLPLSAAWMGLALMAVLNTLVYTLSLQLGPPADPAAMSMTGPARDMPLLFSVMLFGGLALTALALAHVGRFLGGQGGLAEIVPLLAWMQALRLLVQLGVVVLALAAPVLAALVVLVAAVWGVVILLVFVDEAHGLGGLFRAAGVVVVSILALAVGLSLVIGLIGAPMIGRM
ncbi:MAG: YIP1 family protein [Roseovarius sp.]|nr:YIP1 family protein [Roseovarius sp.]MBK44532.1 YIP1 family protein [Roseovarius sp.]